MNELQAKRILVVMDDPIATAALEAVLVAAGAVPVGPARSVREAITLIRSKRIDAAIVAATVGGRSSRVVVAELGRLGVPCLLTGAAPGGGAEVSAALAARLAGDGG